jgi:CRISPR system Cascade subunit CasB
VVLEGLEGEQAPDGVTSAERAAFHALTLFAVHQQSRPDLMHQSGRGLGHAVRELDRRRQDEGSLLRRFAAAAASEDPDELATRLRPLVQQLRAEGIPLDYGKLAADLVQFATPAGRIAVRQRWGRQLHRTGPPAAITEHEDDPSTPTSKEQP